MNLVNSSNNSASAPLQIGNDVQKKATYAEKIANKMKPIMNFIHLSEEIGIIFSPVIPNALRALLSNRRDIIATSLEGNNKKIILLFAFKEIIDSLNEHKALH